MPQTLTFTTGPEDKRGDYPVATEDELLEFVNKARQAGGANVLDALLPSRPSMPSACLIANGLNFGCSVSGFPGCEAYEDKDGCRYAWGMHLPTNLDRERAEKISKAIDTPILNTSGDEGGYVLAPLPAHIGNAADAFDDGLAFRDFAVDSYGETYEF